MIFTYQAIENYWPIISITQSINYSAAVAVQCHRSVGRLWSVIARQSTYLHYFRPISNDTWDQRQFKLFPFGSIPAFLSA